VELATRAAFPATARSQDRLAFVRVDLDIDIYRLQSGGSPTPLIASTFDERHPQYSPDGRRIAFQRGLPNNEIWLADADGRNVTQLTRGPGRDQGTPGWSPDGRSIVFDSQAEDGNVDIWTIGVDGSGLRQITHDPAQDVTPTWSRDGRFVYFASNRTGRFEVWRAAATGGAEEQLTHEGGVLPCASLDGTTLFYQRSFETSALLTLPTAGGQERTILPCVVSFGYAVAPKGIDHLACPTPGVPFGQERRLLHWAAATGRDQPVAASDLGVTIVAGLSVSPDGRSIVYGRGRFASDLMMIENFR
jgi:WD40 repeat protein